MKGPTLIATEGNVTNASRISNKMTTSSDSIAPSERGLPGAGGAPIGAGTFGRPGGIATAALGRVGMSVRFGVGGVGSVGGVEC